MDAQKHLIVTCYFCHETLNASDGVVLLPEGGVVYHAHKPCWKKNRRMVPKTTPVLPVDAKSLKRCEKLAWQAAAREEYSRFDSLVAGWRRIVQVCGLDRPDPFSALPLYSWVMSERVGRYNNDDDLAIKILFVYATTPGAHKDKIKALVDFRKATRLDFRMMKESSTLSVVWHGGRPICRIGYKEN